MSRTTQSNAQRPLSLTEELERLEQSITLTLQEIDQNFSIAHRIVTTSILPIVDQYAAHSKSVWEGSKFWKQFFESSANVSLSGYEEGEQSSHMQSNTEETVTEETNTTATHTTLSTDDQSYETPSQQHIHTDSIQDLDLSNLTVSPSHSTPRPTKKQSQRQPQFADYPSPYEALRAEVNNTTNLDATSFSQQDPATPGHWKSDLKEITHTPDSSPILPQQPSVPPSARPSTARKRTDPLLHRVLDKTYRIQATPLTSNRYRTVRDNKTTTPTTTRNPLLDSTLSSSPEVAPPELHAEIFSSPERRRFSPTKTATRPQQGHNQPTTSHRTPGVSVLTPASKKFTSVIPTRTPGVWDDSDSDDGIDEATGLPYGASPPKTMQFHIPQSRLLKTPAKEASRLLVNDVLTAAGIHRPGEDGDTEEDLDDFEIDLDATNYGDYDDGDDFNRGGADGHDDADNSPSVVRKAVGLEDETF